MFKKIFIVFFSLLKITLFSQHKTTDWELKKNESGILVYTRQTENSAFKELKSVMYIKSSLSSVIALLADYDSYPQWVYKCGQSFTLKKFSDTACIHYQTVTAPWPISNRDFVVNVKQAQDEKSKIITITTTSNPTYIPLKDKIVRITKFNASWVLTPLNYGKVQIKYQLLVDPGGSLPAWLVNLAVVDGPFDTMLGLQKFILKDKYQKAKIAYIKELMD